MAVNENDIRRLHADIAEMVKRVGKLEKASRAYGAVLLLISVLGMVWLLVWLLP